MREGWFSIPRYDSHCLIPNLNVTFSNVQLLRNLRHKITHKRETNRYIQSEYARKADSQSNETTNHH